MSFDKDHPELIEHVDNLVAALVALLNQGAHASVEFRVYIPAGGLPVVLFDLDEGEQTCNTIN